MNDELRWAEIKEFARPTATFLDIDGELPTDLTERIGSVSQMLRCHVEWARIDRTKHGYHVIIEWSEAFSKLEIVAIQAILGSDFKRETLNLMRARSMPDGPEAEACWNLLYEQKLQ